MTNAIPRLRDRPTARRQNFLSCRVSRLSLRTLNGTERSRHEGGEGEWRRQGEGKEGGRERHVHVCCICRQGSNSRSSFIYSFIHAYVDSRKKNGRARQTEAPLPRKKTTDCKNAGANTNSRRSVGKRRERREAGRRRESKGRRADRDSPERMIIRRGVRRGRPQRCPSRKQHPHQTDRSRQAVAITSPQTNPSSSRRKHNSLPAS